LDSLKQKITILTAERADEGNVKISKLKKVCEILTSLESHKLDANSN
jgi:hypothetical protein